MNSVIAELWSKKYGIVFTSDYQKMILLLLKDLARRDYIALGSTANLGDNKTNRAEIIQFIINNLKTLGYNSSETAGLVEARQMERLQVQIAESASKITIPDDAPKWK